MQHAPVTSDRLVDAAIWDAASLQVRFQDYPQCRVLLPHWCGGDIAQNRAQNRAQSRAQSTEHRHRAQCREDVARGIKEGAMDGEEEKGTMEGGEVVE